MDVIYYNLNARKVKVSGGADLVTLVPTPAAAPAGEVLDFERCRRKLETRNAWKNLSAAAQEVPQPQEPEEFFLPAPHPRRERAATWLDLCASAAVIAVSLAAVAAFLSLL